MALSGLLPVAMKLFLLLLLLLPTVPRSLQWVLEGTSCARPWQAALFQGQKFLCGGTVVAPSWVLTAAHCHVPGPISIRLGAPQEKAPGGGHEWRRSEEAFLFPGYNHSSKDGDLMLLRLRPPLRLSRRLQALPPAAACPRPGTACQVSGWGSTTSPHVTFPQELHCTKVTIVAPELCRQLYSGSITPNMLCAGEASSRADSCQGDSGGPLTCAGRLQGVVSWGPGLCGDPQKPGVYVNLCRYSRWLQQVMRSP